jgi:ferredoxin
MAVKYHIPTSQAPARFQPITKAGVIAWEEGCLKCTRCVKKDCVYKVYEKRNLDPRQMLDSLDTVCMDCFRCVQNCPNRLIQKSINPLYKVLGDDYWTPEIITNIWYQSEAGKIPVSGAGYGGPFSGPGFDSMWTDMSEIVRPTRDGIHGREYISTTVDLGRKLVSLEFDPGGKLVSSPPPIVEIPIPVIFDILPWSPSGKGIKLSILNAAKNTGTFAVIHQTDMTPDMDGYLSNLILYADDDYSKLNPDIIQRLKIIELPDSGDVINIQNSLKRINPGLVIFIRCRLNRNASDRAVELTRAGAEVIHFTANEFGKGKAEDPLFIKDRIKQIHLHMIEAGLRDEVTLIGGGGVAMAEHVAKLVICGADAIAVDIPLLVAMECRVCRRCKEGIPCPVELENVDYTWGSLRIGNLVSGWHNQLLEVMGAMGIREIRRMRGEMGRAMFFEELEKETFSGMGIKGLINGK